VKRRAGFTLTELLVTLVVVAFLGTALARMLINNSRFVSRQDAMMGARESSRAAMNAMLPELRLVSNGGLRMVSRDSVRARIPIAMGMLCRTSGAYTIASLMPYDSLMYTAATLDSLAWLDNLGNYVPVGGVTVASSTATGACQADSIRVIPGGRLVALTPAGIGQPSRLFYLFESVTYRFRNSVEMPGRRALWRQAGGAAAEEIVAPFDTAAQFRFLVGPALVATSTVPAVLDSVRGLEIRLVGQSDAPPQGASTFQSFNLTTYVKFLNRTN
jgi:prepilin-type N-terminal cleavage/methylation domain-containing protein